MEPPHKRLKISKSSSALPIRSNHMRRRRATRNTRSSITSAAKTAKPEASEEELDIPLVAARETQAEGRQNCSTTHNDVALGTASGTHAEGLQKSPTTHNNRAPIGDDDDNDADCNKPDRDVGRDYNAPGKTAYIGHEEHAGDHVTNHTTRSDPALLDDEPGGSQIDRPDLHDCDDSIEPPPVLVQHSIENKQVPTGTMGNVVISPGRDEKTSPCHKTEAEHCGGLPPTPRHDFMQIPVNSTDSVNEDDTSSLTSGTLTGVCFTRLLNRVHIMVSWSRLLACVSLSGRTSMTAEQYDFFRMALQAANSAVTLPTYKTTRTSHWKDFVQIAFPKNIVECLRTTTRHRPTGPSITIGKKEEDPADCVKVVLPSEWAKLDVLSLPFYTDVFERTQRTVFDIESAPIVRNRSLVTGADVTLWCTHDDAVCPCEVGDKLGFICDKSVTGIRSKEIEDVCLHVHRGNTILTNNFVHVVAYLTLTWTVGSTACVDDISKSHRRETLTESEQSVVDFLRDRTPDCIISSARQASLRAVERSSEGRKKQRSQSVHKGMLCLHPGDYCAIVRPDNCNIRGLVCLFVASPTGRVTGETMERIVWVSAMKNCKSLRLTVQAEAIVRNLPVWLGGSRAAPTFRTGFSPNKGKLQDGTNYVVYRLALYADGFKQHKSLADSRSVDGCYMLPLGNSMDGRKSSTSSRVISLTPHGHSANDVLHLIHGDLFKGSREGIKSFDPFGRPVRIFLDVVSMFGDYPALTATADLRGHNATAFCTFCTFRQNPNSKYGSRLYSTVFHSRRPSATRTDKRRLLIRPNLPETALQKLGFKKETMEQTNDLPMVRLARALTSGGVRPTDDQGRQFMPNGFDSVQCMAAAPDHLICGLIEDTLEVCFSSLPSNEDRSKVELRMIMDARENGLREQGKFLRWKDKSFEGLRSISMSTKICMLLTSVRPFNEEHGRTGRSEFLLPQQLQMFVSLVYYTPSIEVEGPPAAELLSPEGYLKLRGNQVRLAREFLDTASAVYKRDPELGGILNKPNAHRAIELCVHTITNFGHARNCSEMVLEMAHRKFKAWLECNTHSDSHISGMERAVCSDWQGRVASMYDHLCNGSEMEKDCASRALRRLLLGEEALIMDENSRQGKDVIESFNRAIRTAMRDPVRREMDLNNQVNCLRGRWFAWQADRSKGEVIVDDIVKSGRKILGNWYSIAEPDATISLSLSNKASYVSMSSSTTRRRTYPHLTVKAGTAVSIITRVTNHTRLVVHEESDMSVGEMQFYAVYGIIAASNGDVWCVSRQLTQDGNIFRAQGNATCVLKMGVRVSRVAVFHACDKECSVDVKKQEVRHGKGMCDGGAVEVAPRFDGYPPHLG